VVVLSMRQTLPREKKKETLNWILDGFFNFSIISFVCGDGIKLFADIFFLRGADPEESADEDRGAGQEAAEDVRGAAQGE
jgi:hypothetical protein